MVGRKSRLSTAEPACPCRYSSTFAGAAPQPFGPSLPLEEPIAQDHPRDFASPPSPLSEPSAQAPRKAAGSTQVYLWGRTNRAASPPSLGPVFPLRRGCRALYFGLGPGGGRPGADHPSGGMASAVAAPKRARDALFRATRSNWDHAGGALEAQRRTWSARGQGLFRPPTCEGLANGAWSWAPPWLKSPLFTLPRKTARCHAIARRAGETSEAPIPVKPESRLGALFQPISPA